MRHRVWWAGVLCLVVLVWQPDRGAAPAEAVQRLVGVARTPTALAEGPVRSAQQAGGATNASVGFAGHDVPHATLAPPPADVGDTDASIGFAGHDVPLATLTPPPADVGDIPAACDGDNPYFVAAVPGRVDSAGAESGAALVAFLDTPGDDPTAHVELATHAQLGATYGLAYDWRRGHLYVGAFHRRAAALGPGGPGQIYRTILASETIEQWAVIAAGPDRHNGVDDAAAMAWVGRSALGDLELDDDGTQLFAVNLYERRIHRFSVPDGASLGSFQHGASNEPWADRARPFGLGFRDGHLMHGVIDEGDPGDAAAVPRLYMYRSRPDGSEMTLVLDADLDYRTRPPWSVWSDDVDEPRGAQPMFADIVFRPTGEPVIGLRDRVADMVPLDASGDVLPSRGGPVWDIVIEPEHYLDRWQRDESLWGALATMPGFDLVVASAGAPIRPASAGAVWFYNETGGEVTSETIAFGGTAAADVAFGGLGDIELLCGPRGAPTLAPTPTPTPTPRPVYVPLALHETCPPLKLDVTLVLDLSSSMRERTAGGRPKVDAALEAAGTFAGLLLGDSQDPTSGNRVAIVGFNALAWTEAPLTADESAIDASLGRLAARIAQQTRLDLAVTEGARATIEHGHRPDAQAVMVLLTDGRPGGVPPAEDGSVATTVLRAADVAKESMIRIYTVGVGTLDDVDAPLLRAMASEPTGYVYAPDAEMLTAVYERLASEVRCPPGGNDWSEP